MNNCGLPVDLFRLASLALALERAAGELTPGDGIWAGMLSLAGSLRVFVVVEACLQRAKGRRSPCGLLFPRQPSARCAANTIVT